MIRPTCIFIVIFLLDLAPMPEILKFVHDEQKLLRKITQYSTKLTDHCLSPLTATLFGCSGGVTVNEVQCASSKIPASPYRYIGQFEVFEYSASIFTSAGHVNSPSPISVCLTPEYTVCHTRNCFWP